MTTVTVQSVNEGNDLLLEGLLSRIGNSDGTTLETLLRRFSKARVGALNLVPNMKDSTVRRQEVIAYLEEMSVTFFKLGLELAELNRENKLENRLASLEEKINNAQETASYAEAAKADKSREINKVQVPSGRAVAPEPKRAVIITPIDEKGEINSSEATKKILLSKIKPTELGIKPDRILRNGKLGVRLEAKSLAEGGINREVLKRVGLKATVVGRLKPRLAVFGVPVDMSSEELKNEIADNYADENIERSKIVVKSKFGPRDRNFCHWVVEVDAGTRKKILTKDRIYVGWSSCVVKNHVRILRCFKCQKFGHMQRDCRGPVRCGKCTGSHDTKECKKTVDEVECINCKSAGYKDIKHEARSQKCPTYIKRVEDSIANTDYE